MEPIPVCDGMLRFAFPNNVELTLDPIEAAQAINRIQNASPDGRPANFEDVQQFADWVAEQTTVRLSKASAYALMLKLRKLFDEGKIGAD